MDPAGPRRALPALPAIGPALSDRTAVAVAAAAVVEAEAAAGDGEAAADVADGHLACRHRRLQKGYLIFHQRGRFRQSLRQSRRAGCETDAAAAQQQSVAVVAVVVVDVLAAADEGLAAAVAAVASEPMLATTAVPVEAGCTRKQSMRQTVSQLAAAAATCQWPD